MNDYDIHICKLISLHCLLLLERQFRSNIFRFSESNVRLSLECQNAICKNKTPENKTAHTIEEDDDDINIELQ